MKIRTIMAVAAGVAAEALTGIALWWMTKMQLHDIIAWMVVAYMAAVDAALWALDKWEIRIRASIRRRDDGPQIYDLRDYPEWADKEEG